MAHNEIHRPTKKPKTDENGVEEWKKQPPYKIHHNKTTNGDDFKTRYEASCHCGKVEYQLSREVPLDSKLCHCTTCQTQHGESLDVGLSVNVAFANIQ